MQDLNEIFIFTKVVQAGSFTQAAQLLGLPKSTVSRKVSLLEARLGVSLLQRTTRKLHLTEVGESYFRSCSQIMSEILEAESAATASQNEPQGLLRVTAPVEMGPTLMGNLIDAYLKKYPKVEVELLLTDRIVDLVGEGFDLAIRAGELEDSSLMAKRLGESGFQIFASPAYLKKNGTPTHPRELEKHSCLRFTPVSEQGVWELTSTKGKYRARIHSRFNANNILLLKELALSGCGIALMPNFMCRDEVERGKLKRILGDWFAEESPVYAVYPGRRFISPKTRVFMEMVAEAFRGFL